jgi:hypothetical protein
VLTLGRRTMRAGYETAADMGDRERGRGGRSASLSNGRRARFRVIWEVPALPPPRCVVGVPRRRAWEGRRRLMKWGSATTTRRSPPCCCQLCTLWHCIHSPSRAPRHCKQRAVCASANALAERPPPPASAAATCTTRYVPHGGTGARYTAVRDGGGSANRVSMGRCRGGSVPSHHSHM